MYLISLRVWCRKLTKQDKHEGRAARLGLIAIVQVKDDGPGLGVGEEVMWTGYTLVSAGPRESLCIHAINNKCSINVSCHHC